MSDQQHARPKHPKLSDKEQERQRGEDPPNPVGQTPKTPDHPDPDPKYVPDPGRADEWRGLAAEIGKEHRPHREDVLGAEMVEQVTRAAGDDLKRTCREDA